MYHRLHLFSPMSATLTGQEKIDGDQSLLRQIHRGLVHLHAHLLRKAVTEWKKKTDNNISGKTTQREEETPDQVSHYS